jgi:superfamily II DNA or RNA helicase
MVTPRRYQTEAIEAILGKWREGVTRQLLSLPTGTGKTVIFALLAQKLDTFTLILAHREELLSQACEKIKVIMPEADVGIFQGSNREGLESRICIASVQTAARHTRNLRQRGFNLLICDEAHHARAPSYEKVFRATGFLENNPDKLLLGVTATPYRMDGRALGGVFEHIVFERSLVTMIREGYLSDIRCISVGTDSNLDNVSIRNGDFANNELELAIDTVWRNQVIVDAYKNYCMGKKAVAFGVSVEHAQSIAREFQLNGIPCGVMWGDMGNEERKEELARFASGEIKVLSNCMLLTEGFDAPDIDAILMSRPTKSKGLYTQCVGRGLRLAPGKKECLLLDFVDISRKHDLCSLGTLLGRKIRSGESLLEVVEEGEWKNREPQSGLVVIHKNTEEVDPLGRERFQWMPFGEGYRLLVKDSAITCVPHSDGYCVFLVEKEGKTFSLVSKEVPLEAAMAAAENYACKTVKPSFFDQGAKWRKEKASEKQLQLLDNLRLPHNPVISKGEAANLLNQYFNQPATAKQLWYLNFHNLHPFPEVLSKKEAGQIIQKSKEGKPQEEKAIVPQYSLS